MTTELIWPANICKVDEHVFSKDIVKEAGIPFRQHVLHRAVVTRRGIFSNFCLPTRLGFPGAEPQQFFHWRYMPRIVGVARFIAYYVRFIFSPLGLTRVMKPEPGETFVMVSDQWSDYYYHWFTDALPRLLRMMEKTSMTKNEVRIVLPANHDMSFVRKSLDILGFRYVFLERGRNHYFSRLHIPSHCGRPGLFNYPLEPTSIALREGAAEHVRPSVGKKLYISRSRARCRLVVNEEQIVPLLQEFGFEVVNLEEHPWEKQLQIVSEASVIMGPHGAGFTHMYMLEKGSKVVELRVGEADTHNNCLFNMAVSLGHHYYYLFCKGIGVCNIPGDDNLEVDPEKMRQLLVHLSAVSSVPARKDP